MKTLLGRSAFISTTALHARIRLRAPNFARRRYNPTWSPRRDSGRWKSSTKVLAGAVTTSCLILLASHTVRESLNHAVTAAERSCRVFYVLAVCIHEYDLRSPVRLVPVLILKLPQDSSPTKGR